MKWFHLNERTLTVDINGVIGGDTWFGDGYTPQDLRNAMRDHEKYDKIVVNISSPGGIVYDGFDIYNALRDARCQIEVNIGALAGSIASVIAMAGDVRRAHKNSTFMVHKPWVMIQGDANDLRIEADALDKLQKATLSAYGRSKLSEDEINGMLDATTYLDSEEMLLYGFATEIIDNDATVSKVAYDVNSVYAKAPVAVARMLNIVDENQSDNQPLGAANCPGEPTIQQGKGQQMPTPEDLAKLRDEEQKAAALAERQRIGGIRLAAKTLGVSDDAMNAAIDSGKDLAAVQAEFISAVASAPPAQAVSVGADDSDKFAIAATTRLAMAASLPVDEKDRTEAMKSQAPSTIHGMIRACAERAGVKVPHGATGMDLARIAKGLAQMSGQAQTSDSLPAIFADVINKGFKAGADRAPTTYQMWAGRETLNDFRAKRLVDVSQFSSMDVIPEGKAFAFGSFSDESESLQATTKGKAYLLTMQSMVNDDMDFVGKVPIAIGASWRRKINQLVYDKLVESYSATGAGTMGPTMADTVSMFIGAASATRPGGNVNMIEKAGTGAGVPSTAALAAGRRAIMTQPLLAPEDNQTTTAAKTNIPPKFLVTTPTNEQVSYELLVSSQRFDPATAIPNNANFFGAGSPGALTPVIEAYLESIIASGDNKHWFLLTDPMMMGTITVGYLEGRDAPFIRSEESAVGEALGMKWDIYGSYGVAAENWRGAYFNYGE